MSYILELGLETGDGKHKVWECRGFYAGYTEQGPIIAETIHGAYQFPKRDFAENIRNGDERMRQSRVVPYESE